MKVAAILFAGAILIGPALAQAQTGTDPAVDKVSRPHLVKVPRAAATAPARYGADTDRVIDDELKRTDHMMSICTGC